MSKKTDTKVNQQQNQDQDQKEYTPFLIINPIEYGKYDNNFLEQAKKINDFADKIGVEMKTFDDIKNVFGFYVTDGIGKAFSLIELIEKMSEKFEATYERLEKVAFTLEKSVNNM